MRSSRVLPNTIFNLAGLMITSALAVLLTPYLLVQLGEELFGLWALAGVVITGAPLVTLGLGRALARNTAQHEATGATDAINRDLNSVWWPLLGLAGITTLAGWGLSPELAKWLGMPEEWVELGVRVLRLLWLSVPAVGLGQLLAATIEGAQRMIFTSAALTLSRILFAAGAVAAVLLDAGVVGVAAAYLCSVWVQFGLLFWAAPRVRPSQKLMPLLAEGSIFWRDLRFGGQVFSASLLGLAFAATNKIVLARWVGLEGVAYFEFASVVAMQLFNIANAAALALYPAFAAAQVEGVAAVRRLYLRGLRLLSLSVLPLAAGIVALAGPFAAAWFEGGGGEAAGALQALALAWAFTSLAAVAAAGFQAVNRPGMALLFAAYNMVLNLFLALVFVPRFGFGGLIAANAAAVISSALLTLAGFGRHCRATLREMAAALSPGVLLWLGLLAALFWGIGTRLFEPRLLHLVGLGTLFGLIYVAGLWRLRLFRPDEIGWLKRLFSGSNSVPAPPL